MRVARRHAVLVMLLAGLPLLPAAAQDYRLGPLRIEQPWSRATAPGAQVGVGYFVLVNEGETDARLVAAAAPVAGRVTLHRSVEADGVARMEHQRDGVVVPAGGRLAFQPGGYHLMLMQLARPLAEGDRVPLTLEFEQAGTVAVELEVKGLTAGVE
ncbi:MAG: copper chaperone PCu(A)C [Halofilum sp. (in: g-proteobacteria)]|nr:copper chaperone PCu(A)C [Halofilum sp. (in: g-proteobacteria)]